LHAMKRGCLHGHHRRHAPPPPNEKQSVGKSKTVARVFLIISFPFCLKLVF
jgi:hypothetical protein